MKFAAATTAVIVAVAGSAFGQHHFGHGGGSRGAGGYGGGVQTLQSSPLPPPGYISPSALREKTEPPKPFAFKHEGPDPYGGYSSHESQGDEYGRVSGQYTVKNPDGTSRVVKYVADPEHGFHAEVDTDEEGTKTSAPANALIRSSAPEEGYYPQAAKKAFGPAPAAYAATAYGGHHKAAHNTGYGIAAAGGYGATTYKAAAAYTAPSYRAAPAPYARSNAYHQQHQAGAYGRRPYY